MKRLWALLPVALVVASPSGLEGRPILVATNISERVVTNAYSVWRKSTGFDDSGITSVQYSNAIQNCDQSTPEVTTNGAPDCWGNVQALTTVTFNNGWLAWRDDKSTRFDVNTGGEISNQYVWAALLFGFQGQTNVSYSGPLTLGGLTNVDTGWLSAKWPDWPYTGSPFPPFPGNILYNIGPMVYGLYPIEDQRRMTLRPNAEVADVGEPINTITGNMGLDETDIDLATPGLRLAFQRSYNSASTNEGALGAGWCHSFDWRLTIVTNILFGTTNSLAGFTNAIAASTNLLVDLPNALSEITNVWTVLRVGNGCSYSFRNKADGTFERPPENDWQLSRTGTEYRFLQAGGLSHTFDSNGLLVAIGDAWGNALSLAYTNRYGLALLSGIAQGNGRKLTLSYESNLLVCVATPSSNLWVTYAYNAARQLTNATVHAGDRQLTTTYCYDEASHALTQRINAAGTPYSWNYATNPATGELQAIGSAVASDKMVCAIVYPTNGSHRVAVTYRRDQTNAVYDYEYVPVTNVIADIAGPDSATAVRYQYDTNGNATGETAHDYTTGMWSERQRQYDSGRHVTNEAFGYCATASTVLGMEWETQWRLPKAARDAEGRRWEWDYTNGSVCAERTFPATNLTAETRYAYTTNGWLAAVTNANGHWVRYLHDAYGNPTSSIPQAGPTNWMVWDSLGHLKQLLLSSHQMTTDNPPQQAMVPRVIAFDSDELGRIRSIVWPDGTTNRFAYDAIGNLTNAVDAGGRIREFTWLPTRKPASATQYLSRGGSNQAATVSLDYDRQLNVMTVKDELGRSAENYTLDLADRPVKVANLESQQMTIVWGLSDYVKERVRFDGTTNTFAYDRRGNLSQVTYPDGTLVFTWFDNGLLAAISNAAGTVSNAFDGANRLVSSRSVGGPLDRTVTYGLDLGGNATNVTLGGTACQVMRTFDAAERLSTISAGGFIATLGYDSANGLLANLAMSNGLSCAYAYDKMDRLTGLSWKNASNEVLRRQNYSYTLAGLIEGVETEDGDRIAYTYDTLDRLTGEKRTDVYGRVLSHAAYDYDLAGNRTQKTVLDSQSNVLLTVRYTLGTGNRLASWSVAETDLCGLVDVAGHSSAPIRRDDHWGYLWVSNSVSGKVKPEVEGTNFWSYGLRVGLGTQRVYAAIRDLAGNTAYITNAFKLTVVTNASYRYSAAGCLTNIAYRGKDYSQTVGLSWNGEYQLTAVTIDGAIAERYGYDGLGRRVWTWDAASGTNWHVYDGQHVMADLNATGGLLRAYTYGPGIDNVLAMTTYGAATSTVYYVKDRLGSVLALADRNGTMLESYRYDAWGRTTVYDASGNTLTQSAYGNRYGWQGREYSFKTGFHYFRARWYDPVTVRWLSNDPIGISGGLNQYVFCGNNPVNFRDAFGLDYRFIQEWGTPHTIVEIKGKDGVSRFYEWTGLGRTEDPISNLIDIDLGIWVPGHWYQPDRTPRGISLPWHKTKSCEDKALINKFDDLIGAENLSYNLYRNNSFQAPRRVVDSVLHPQPPPAGVFQIPNWNTH